MSIPGWVNRGAKIAGALGMGGSGAGQQAVDLEGRPLRPEDAAALVMTTAEDVCIDALLDRGVAVLGAKPSQSLISIIPVDAKGARLKLKPDAVLQSDSDEQLLLFLPFVHALSLRSLLLRLSSKDPSSNPRRLLLFADRRNLDFSDVDSVTPTQIWDLPAFDRTPTTQEKKDGLYEAVFEFQAAKWRSVALLTIFVESNHGAAATKIHGLTIVGRDK